MSFVLQPIPPDQPLAGVVAGVVPALDAETAEMLAEGLAVMRQVARPPVWGNYMAWRDGVAVGCCGFKALPDSPPEIGYMTFARAEGTGVATAMVGALLAIATAAGATSVTALTLPAPNASNRALARNGFVHAGDVIDPDEGPVWRWEWHAVV
ncbi:GNAT family N-acetyltransferase [Sandarakinorhabdus sp. DWP1-3-1]|uniref:GNAT family N-acetyltransferase n=1 Tax=Sandarakinorhabdus sp. DWP1-3-1 TaxID=2804627 RepID=UPI003CF9A8BA